MNTAIDPPATGTEALPVLLGTLSIEAHWRRAPQLYLSVRCCHCGREHHHGWGLIDAGQPHPRQPHCSGVRVGMLPEYRIFPAPTERNRQVLREYEAALKAHRRRFDDHE